MCPLGGFERRLQEMGFECCLSPMGRLLSGVLLDT
jgi:hypothetical protein